MDEGNNKKVMGEGLDAKGSESQGTSLFSNGVLWFGAGISLAEILTGTYLGGLDTGEAILAILLGHLIGGVLLFLTGLIGARTGLSAMDTVKGSFGVLGGRFFALANVLQLVGWTAIMIYDGALAAEGIYPLGVPFYAVLLGALLLFWLFRGLGYAGRVNVLAVSVLFLLSLLISWILFSGTGVAVSSPQGMTFGAALELSIVMPLSWLPLISDYTSKASSPVKGAAVSAVSYTVASSWMYGIGMILAARFGETDISALLMQMGLGAAALFIILFSTVTTAFLDAYSAGVSAYSVSDRFETVRSACAVVLLGTVAACLFPMDDITDFLYFLGSVFAPMTAILLADFFLLGKREKVESLSLSNTAIWILGFILYRYVMYVDFPYGYTLPTMILVAFCRFLLGLWERK